MSKQQGLCGKEFQLRLIRACIAGLSLSLRLGLGHLEMQDGDPDEMPGEIGGASPRFWHLPWQSRFLFPLGCTLGHAWAPMRYEARLKWALGVGNKELGVGRGKKLERHQIVPLNG